MMHSNRSPPHTFVHHLDADINVFSVPNFLLPPASCRQSVSCVCSAGHSQVSPPQGQRPEHARTCPAQRPAQPCVCRVLHVCEQPRVLHQLHNARPATLLLAQGPFHKVSCTLGEPGGQHRLAVQDLLHSGLFLALWKHKFEGLEPVEITENVLM